MKQNTMKAAPSQVTRPIVPNAINVSTTRIAEIPSSGIVAPPDLTAAEQIRVSAAHFVSVDYQMIAETIKKFLPDLPAVEVAVYPRRPYNRGCHNEGEHFGIVIVTSSPGSYTERIYAFNPLVISLAEQGLYPRMHVYTESEASEAGGIDELARFESPAFKRIIWR